MEPRILHSRKRHSCEFCAGQDWPRFLIWGHVDFLSSWTDFLRLCWLLILCLIFKCWHSLWLSSGRLFNQHVLTRQYHSWLIGSHFCISGLDHSLKFVSNIVNCLRNSSTWYFAGTSNSTRPNWNHNLPFNFFPSLFPILRTWNHNVYNCTS